MVVCVDIYIYIHIYDYYQYIFFLPSKDVNVL